MIDFNQPAHYEHIHFYQKDFPFGTYTIPNTITLPHWHTHMEFIYAKIGTCDVYINGTQYPCTEGNLIIIPRNSLHSIIPRKNSTYIAIVVGDYLLNDLKSDMHLSSILNIYHKINNPITFNFSTTLTLYQKIINPIKNIITEYEKKDSHYKIQIKLYLCNFFTLIHRELPEIFLNKELLENAQTDYMKSSIEYLTENFNKKITISQMCSRINLSEQHFSRLFKSYTGKTFIEYLTLFRLEQAEKLLCQSNIPITQIPELTGFCNANYFSRIYKKHYNQSPSLTRKSRNSLTR